MVYSLKCISQGCRGLWPPKSPDIKKACTCEAAGPRVSCRSATTWSGRSHVQSSARRSRGASAVRPWGPMHSRPPRCRDSWRCPLKLSRPPDERVRLPGVAGEAASRLCGSPGGRGRAGGGRAPPGGTGARARPQGGDVSALFWSRPRCGALRSRPDSLHPGGRDRGGVRGATGEPRLVSLAACFGRIADGGGTPGDRWIVRGVCR